MKKVTLKKGKDTPVTRKHPWVFSGAILKKDEGISDGDLVRVESNNGKFLGLGHYHGSSISVRIFSFNDATVDEKFWLDRLTNAFLYRKQLGLLNEKNNCFRLVFGESDSMPGLILDYYDGNIVFQAHTLGMHKLSNVLKESILKVPGLNVKTIYDKSKDSLPSNHTQDFKNNFLFGNNEAALVYESGYKFHVDWVKGQKTGFFLDQRDNRKLLAEYSAGNKVLNTFCYTGGFSVYAGKANALLIHSVDSSKSAIALTEKNITENNILYHQSFCVDTFDFLKSNELDYEVMILDPPAFAKHIDAKHRAVIGYKNLNALVLKKAKVGSVIFTFSCTQVVDKLLFFNTISAAAIDAGREIRILHYLHQPPDHPINPLHPESEYLKGLVIIVVA
ncbi:MAG: class I SAM-dependent rRNA methyltransferase [Bacteroidota bacterium]